MSSSTIVTTVLTVVATFFACYLAFVYWQNRFTKHPQYAQLERHVRSMLLSPTYNCSIHPTTDIVSCPNGIPGLGYEFPLSKAVQYFVDLQTNNSEPQPQPQPEAMPIPYGTSTRQRESVPAAHTTEQSSATNAVNDGAKDPTTQQTRFKIPAPNFHASS